MQNQSFLDSLAQKCYEKYGSNADKLTIVFPNRRAGLFFRKYLAKCVSKPVWSPYIISLEEFILSKSELTPADHLQSIFTLYSSYKELHKSAESFDKFFYWGEMILKDFNDIDNYLVNPEHIFRIIQSQKELDEAFYFLPEEDQKVIKSFWSGFLPKASKSQSEFLSTWKILNELYKKFNEALLKEGSATKGMIYRLVAADIENENKIDPKKDIWFAGFNALTNSEEKIIKHYITECESEMYWDIDDYYLKDENQEAGFFFRKYRTDPVFNKTFPKKSNDRISNRNGKIVVTSVPLEEGQVKAVGEALNKLSQQEGFEEENTAIVLPNENLLLPLLNSIPSSVKKVNVTMGYPLGNSHYFSFFEALLNLHNSRVSSAKSQPSFYFKDILAVLNHEVCKVHFSEDSDRLIKHIHSNNRVRLNENEIQEIGPSLVNFIHQKEDINELLLDFQDLIETFLDKCESSLDKTILFNLQLTFKNIIKASISYDIRLERDTLTRIYKRIGSSTKIPFTGEPLEGIQIMGALETRNLDFDNIFILSLNEGTFPSDSSNSSFIPYNIRKAFDLPAWEHNDALQSYLFYRLLHNGGNIHCYYNNISEFNHNGELSRFIKQLKYESGLRIKRKSLVNPIKPSALKPIVINKSEAVSKALSIYFVNKESHYKRLSPSALNTYLDCRLKFYFRYIEKIKEPDEVSDDLDPALFGNLLHTSMEYVYSYFAKENPNVNVTSSDISKLILLIPDAIDFAFNEHKIAQVNDDNQNGRSIIAEEVIKKYIEAILKFDQGYAPFKINALEVGEKEGYALDLPVQIDGKEVHVGLKGIIDRIDQKEDTIRILDYKSGRDERYFSNIESLFDRNNTKRNKAVMQVLYYCLLYKAKHTEKSNHIIPGLFNSRDLFSRDFDVKIKHNKSFIEDFSTVEAEYTQALSDFVSEIFDPAVAFDQTDDIKKCNYCPYVGICMR